MEDIRNWIAGLGGVGGTMAGVFRLWTTKKENQLKEKESRLKETENQLRELHQIIADLRDECKRRQGNEKSANEESQHFKAIADKLQKISNRQALEEYLFRKERKDAVAELKQALVMLRNDADGCERKVSEVVGKLEQDIKIPDEVNA